ncbi:fumarylacetoacetate hydrolase family protein [Flexivirga oryzae]|uniref:2-keto-4-pentenoate hydratase/2-oxohepta-3-ene-1,7-dioic acid hydratase in catechol pathway n=1 Tax=Flexivirga oryzae TaxID=1794944 RepID=A0A839N3H7_9MICO|nr:fumarylacetoacetate hydrolase family protein [Flexivirga oryzae]MBB2891867.1 2-keto-4-pentenoate hydratase/2-oxohepta-3-ene-1,7-dioic acid hydratase in catechol pathway [Flexivirga oryzae]
MRFGTAAIDGRTTAVVIDGLTAHPVPGGHSVEEIVSEGLDRALALGERAVRVPGAPLDQIRLLAPYRPTSIRDFVAFEEHVEGVRSSVEGAEGVPDAWYDAPTFYFANPHTVLGPGEEVARPTGCRALDFELEVGVVLGAGGSSLTEAQAADAIFGYTLFNDFSARDLQAREMQVGLGPAKGKDFGSALGPWIVTADEVADCVDADGFLSLRGTAEINGVQIGDDSLRHMGWPFPTLIAYASRDSAVRAGDLLGSGTLGNGGCLAELWGRRGSQLPPPLEPGDTVTIAVGRLGSLTNTIIEAAPAPALRPFRPRS